MKRHTTEAALHAPASARVQDILNWKHAKVWYLTPHFRQLHNNSIGRHFSGKVVNNELTLKIPQLRSRTFIYYFVFAFLEICSFK
jgi:hypothetical protein